MGDTFSSEASEQEQENAGVTDAVDTSDLLCIAGLSLQLVSNSYHGQAWAYPGSFNAWASLYPERREVESYFEPQPEVCTEDQELQEVPFLDSDRWTSEELPRFHSEPLKGWEDDSDSDSMKSRLSEFAGHANQDTRHVTFDSSVDVMELPYEESNRQPRGAHLSWRKRRLLPKEIGSRAQWEKEAEGLQTPRAEFQDRSTNRIFAMRPGSNPLLLGAGGTLAPNFYTMFQ